MGKKIKLIFIIAIISTFVSYASDVKFYNINSLYGISMRETASVCKDKEGFIWASSKTGILRLTEDDYKIYQLPYETANIISVKLVCEHSGLIAFTNNGQIFSYNQIYDRFDLLINLSKELNDSHLGVNSILIDNDNTYWIASTAGLYQYKGDQLSLAGNNDEMINKAIWLNNQQILFTSVNGIAVMNTKTLESHFLYNYKDSNRGSFEVSILYLDKSRNQLWVGTLSNGLFYYDFKEGTFTNSNISSLPKQPILAIEPISDTTLLLGIDGQGIWKIDRQNNRVLDVYKENVDNPSSLRGNGVYDIYCDEDKRVWVATYSDGVSYFDQASPIVNQITHQTNNSNSLANNDVNCLIEDSHGNMWIATNNGISYWEVSTNKWRNFYVNKQEQAQVFLTLCEDNQGRIWAGTYSSGVYVLDEETGKQLAHYSQLEAGAPFVNNFVFDIFKDDQGDIWIGGINSEVIRYEPGKNIFRKYSVQPVNVLSELSRGYMLFGCTYGLCVSDNKTGELTPLINGCLVHDILVKDSTVWIGTSGDGLIRFDPRKETSEYFTTQNGLPSNFVNSVAFSDGYLWLGTENGLCRFDPKEKNALIYSSIRSLSNISFNRNAHFNLRNGMLAWGTNKGIVIFNPKTLQQLQKKGKIFLQDLSISGRSIRDISKFKLNTPLDQIDKIVLKYNQNTLTLELLPIGIASGSKLSWKMEGMDEDWTQPASHRLISYSNMPSKEYKLKIRLYDNSLSQILAERTFEIRITPPFWGKWWFLIVVFIIISSIIYVGFWYYINLLKQEHTEEKIRFFTNTAHEIRTSLTLIKAPVEELSKEKNLSETGRHYLHLAIEQARRLSSVVTQLMDFQKADIGKEQMSLKMVDLVKLVNYRKLMFESFAQTKNIELFFTSDQPSYFTAIDESMIEKVVDNLISNAIKYSHPDNHVYINLNWNNNNWIFEVKDHGIGINRKEQRQLFREFYRGENAINSRIVGSGIGLLLARNYVVLHGGTISCSSQENIGSTFQVVIPRKEVSEEIKSADTANSTNIAVNSIETNRSQTMVSEEKKQPKEIRILIVEDTEELRNFMNDSLQEEFDVLTAKDGDDAWKIIQKEMPDLVISDVMMPNMNGFELCQLMKSSYEYAHIPIILLTALSEKAEKLHGLGLGADDYLTKPFDIPLLIQKIKSIISNRITIRKKALRLTKENENDEPILENELNDKFVKKALDVVRSNMSNPKFGKNEFSFEMNVSTSLLYKKIKSLTDQSPVDFIKTVRMNHALELLQSGKYNVTEVSELSGFSSVGYFSTVFKKHFGKSPTEILV